MRCKGKNSIKRRIGIVDNVILPRDLKKLALAHARFNEIITDVSFSYIENKLTKSKVRKCVQFLKSISTIIELLKIKRV